MRFGSLFAGIGGIDLGLERAGMTCAWQVEIDPFCQKVLAKHWPDVPRFGDIKEVTEDELRACGPIELLCGGFPCQPHSLAGKRLASNDERDLWGEYLRIIRITRPRWVLAENVPGLLSSEKGAFFGRVLGDLASLGYAVEWDRIAASDVGAPHLRRRIFILAHAISPGLEVREVFGRHRDEELQAFKRSCLADRGETGWSVSESGVGRMADGVPDRLDRIGALGNAVVPQVAEFIGRMIMEATAC